VRRRQPPWWPEGEEWPPQHWQRRRRPPFFVRLGCTFVLLFVFAAFALTGLVALVDALVSGTANVTIGAIAAFVIGAIVASALALRGVRRMSAPLEDLADAAERIERGDYSTRVTVRGPGRIRSLARAFNDMSQRLESADERRRAFLADAAHELRTPLSIIAGQIEAIEDGVYPADAQHLAPVHEQLRVLEQLIDDMRTVSLAESGALQLKLQPTDLSTAIDQAVAAFSAPAKAARVELTADYPAGLPQAMADEQRLGQVLLNLLSNALRHAPSGGHVTIAARPLDGWVEIAVHDDGEGISQDLLPRVFDRFAREAGSSGSGLGLAICKDLVEAMGGRIAADSAPGTGTTITFTLPAAL
jgi:signal transduction histidine kinase